MVEQELTLDNVNTLIQLYQKAIEYYSASGGERFHDFLSRMQNLYKREDVNAVLNSIQDEEARVVKAVKEDNKEKKD